MVYNEILIDHTSIHALISGVTDKKSMSWKALEVFHFIEEALLSNKIWVCDTVSRQTAENTQKFFDLLRKHGLSTYSNTEGFVLVHFSGEDISSCCRSAAVGVEKYVSSVNVADLSDVAKTNMLLRPKGVQPLDFPAIVNIPFGSDEAENFIQSAFRERGWLPMAAMPLLNPHLYQWLQDFVTNYPSSDCYAYRQLNTICRWQFNEKICGKLSREKGLPVNYVPAAGRVKTIEKVLKNNFDIKKAIIRRLLTNTIDREDLLKESLGQLTPTTRFPLPFLGVWVFSQLSSTPTIDELLQKIAELRVDKRVLRFKSLLQSINEDNAIYIQQELNAEIKSFARKHKNTKQSNLGKVEASVNVPLLPFGGIKLKKEIDTSTLISAIGKKIKRFTQDEGTVILTGLVEDCFSLDLESETFNKLRYILQSGQLIS
jgi:hypothetical protein